MIHINLRRLLLSLPGPGSLAVWHRTHFDSITMSLTSIHFLFECWMPFKGSLAYASFLFPQFMHVLLYEIPNSLPRAHMHSMPPMVEDYHHYDVRLMCSGICTSTAHSSLCSINIHSIKISKKFIWDASGRARGIPKSSNIDVNWIFINLVFFFSLSGRTMVSPKKWWKIEKTIRRRHTFRRWFSMSTHIIPF